ncbi:hypothetical protein GOODEAATRI_016972, partial [Goodea atripinnis]
MAQQYYEYTNYKEEDVQEQRKLPKGACHSYIIVFQSVFYAIFNGQLDFVVINGILFPPQSYGVCILGLKSLWLLIMVYGLSCSVFSLLSLSLLRLPRWVCLMGGAAVHGVLLVVLLALSVKSNSPEYLGPLLVIMVLWGLGSALNKAGISSEYHLS